jgi:hypothetical protein
MLGISGLRTQEFTKQSYAALEPPLFSIIYLAVLGTEPGPVLLSPRSVTKPQPQPRVKEIE